MSLYEDIYMGGVVGAGGAGFPTHIKYKNKAKHLIINGAECEPLLFTDQYEMINHADEIIDGIILGQAYLGAEKTTLVTKKKFKRSIQALEEAIEKRGARIAIKKLDSYYPAGDEHSVIYEATGQALGPGRLPIEQGIVVSNVTTMKNIHRSSLGQPVTRKVVTVSGQVRQPKILDLPLGVSIEECIGLAGSTDLEDYYILLGGPMMGRMISREEAKTTVVTKTTGGILVFDRGHKLISKRLLPIETIRNRAASACIHCTFCTELCPRYLKGHPLHPHEVMIAFAQNDPSHPLLKQADLCCSCGICELYACPMEISPKTVLTHVKGENRTYQNQRVDWETEGVRDSEIFRKLPTDRLIMKLDLDQYLDLGYEDLIKERVDVKKVALPLSQHIGRPATPLVKPGDRVEEASLIARVDLEDVGANIHASIAGQVRSVDDKIIIEGETI